MADGRKRANVLVGAPDVEASGGATFGDVAQAAGDFPTDATAAFTGLNHSPLGFISQDGITKTVDRQTEKIKDWNGDTVIVLETDHSVTLQFTFLETANAEALKAVYGEENVTVTGEKIEVKETAGELPHYSYLFQMKGGNGAKIRVFAPDAQVTSIGDVQYVKNNVISYQVTVECFAVDNKKLVSYIDKPSSDD